MNSDFIGLRVIWPPNGAKPPRHEHDIVFVHDIHNGSISDWRDENGVCWPAEHLSLDLGNARILAFGYDPRNLGIQSDGFFEGGLIFNQGQNLWLELKTLSRSSNEEQVPLTFVGHGAGGIIVKSTLCIAHLRDEALDLTLRKTKHTMFLNTPQSNLTWEFWQKFAKGSPGAESEGEWKVWSTALQNVRNMFNEIAYRFNITTANSEDDELSNFIHPLFTGQHHERNLTLQGLDNQSISRLSRDSCNYNMLLDSVRESMQRMIYSTQSPKDFAHIRSWLGRKFDRLNIDSCEKNLAKQFTGTGQWLYDHFKFRDWGSPQTENPVLWLTGPEGCGKSVIASVTRERLRYSDQQPAAVSFMLAFDHPRSEYHLLTQLVLQLLNHLIATQGSVNAEVLSLLTESNEARKKLSRMHALIRVLVSQCQFVYILIDGLDEVVTGKDSAQTDDENAKIDGPLKHLQSMVAFCADFARNSEQTPVRLWCSSRYMEIIAIWMREIKALELAVEKSAVTVDAARYLDHYSKKIIGKNTSEESYEMLTEHLHKVTGYDFLFASMIVNRMCGLDLSSDRAVRAFIRDAPKNRQDLFQDQWDRLQSATIHATYVDNEAKPPVIKSIISLVAFAKRPLTISELREALLFCGIASLDIDSLNSDRIQTNCEPFVDLYDTTRSGQELHTPNDENKQSYLRLAHASVFKFLSKVSKGPISVSDQMHSKPDLIAHTCLRYLSQERYSDPRMAIPQNHYFLGYAAKYWHRHVEESERTPFLLRAASLFLELPQFLTITRFQSLLLHRHFSRSLSEDDSLDPPNTFTNIPIVLETEENTPLLIDDYRNFVREWSHFLDLGTTNFELRGQIEHCFWGALGKRHSFQSRGSRIEKNFSFLLEYHDDIADGGKVAGETRSNYRFHQSINHEGNRATVWKYLLQDIEKEESRHSEYIKVYKETWHIDGYMPPYRDSTQECIFVDTKRTQLNSYLSCLGKEFTLIPAIDSQPRAPAFTQSDHGNTARIGRILYSRSQEGEWASDTSNDGNGTSQWDSIQSHGPWIIRSCRKFVDAAVREQYESINQENKTQPDSSNLSKTGPPQDESQVLPAESSHESPGVGTSQLDHAVGENCSEKGSGSSSVDGSSASEVVISSAEENCVASASDVNSFSEDSWLSSEANDSSESEKLDDNQSVTNSTSDISVERGSKRTRVIERTSKSMFPSEDSDADDESSEPEDDEQDSNSNNHEKPIHLFSGYHTCDLCGMGVVSINYMCLENRLETFHQCGICRRAEDGSGGCYDICSRCFDKGFWCKNPNHLLSKAIVSIRDQKITWEDRISQQTAPPLVKIVAERRQNVARVDDGPSTTHCFRYMQRHASMLHGSQPVVHLDLPLLVYPLDGRKLLFGNLQENTYFTYNIPFQTSETAETSGNTCIPISVAVQFSPCGRLIHLIRFTARNNITANTHGNIRVYALIVTIALSSKDPCSGRPHLLPFRQGFDLGTCPGFVQELPFTVTWTDSHAYISMSLDFLRVYRFQRCIDQRMAPDVDITQEVQTFCRYVPLPQSARSRVVKFFPSQDRMSARLILGPLFGKRPQPPIVVYLKIEDSKEWVTQKEARHLASFQTLFSFRDDPLLEEPYIEDDEGLLGRRFPADEALTVEPIIPFRRWLQTGFQTRDIYCPSCFELSLRLNFLRPPSYLTFYFFDTDESEFHKYKIEWRVKPLVFIDALRSGCQFCCYVAIRLLSFSHIRHTSQYIGAEGTRCCAKGSNILRPDEIEKVIGNIGKMEWAVEPDKQVIIFECQPINQDIRNRVFDKMAIRIPSLSTGKKGSTKFAPTMLMIHGQNDEGESHAITTFLHHESMSQGTPECVLELYALPNNAAHELIETTPLTTFRGGDKNIKVIQSWLNDCQSNHAFCRRNENTQVPLPTRLLEIVDGTYVSLVETGGQVGQYIALSYCWGPKPENNSMTTTTNLQERLKVRSLLRSELPAAIGDAISVTERLGVRYIWIDALCMIQDSLDDKHRELGHMSMYYRNSFLTIAVSTPSCTTGFVGQLGRCEKHPGFELPRDLVPLEIFAMAQKKDCGQRGTVYVREENPYRLYEEPINKRAWTLQEYILAPRILMFGSRVMWFCQHMTHSDGGVEDWSLDENELERTRREFQIALTKLEKDVPAEQQRSDIQIRVDTSDIHHLWHRIVGTYSRRSLTNAADKLRAISAVASEFAKFSNDEYVAGLWRSNLLRDLLWKTSSPFMHKPKIWRAPSWSWVSVDDTILYEQPPPGTATQLAQVVSVEVVPISPIAPFGEIGRGTLVITAPSLTVNFSDADDSKEISNMLLRDFYTISRQSERDFLLDALKSSSRPGVSDREDDKAYEFPEEIFIVCIYGEIDELTRRHDAELDTKTKKQRWMMWGLVLKQFAGHSEHQVFERILTFSRIPLTIEDFDKFLSERRAYQII